jgi:hypothetical protein
VGLADIRVGRHLRRLRLPVLDLDQSTPPTHDYRRRHGPRLAGDLAVQRHSRGAYDAETVTSFLTASSAPAPPARPGCGRAQAPVLAGTDTDSVTLTNMARTKPVP